MAGTGLSQEGDGDQSLSGERGSWASIRGEGAREARVPVQGCGEWNGPG